MIRLTTHVYNVGIRFIYYKTNYLRLKLIFSFDYITVINYGSFDITIDVTIVIFFNLQISHKNVLFSGSWRQK